MYKINNYSEQFRGNLTKGGGGGGGQGSHLLNNTLLMIQIMCNKHFSPILTSTLAI